MLRICLPELGYSRDDDVATGEQFSTARGAANRPSGPCVFAGVLGRGGLPEPRLANYRLAVGVRHGLTCLALGGSLGTAKGAYALDNESGSRLIPGERFGRRLWLLTCPTTPPESARPRQVNHGSGIPASV